MLLTIVPVLYEGKIIRKLELKIPVIGNQILGSITAGQNDLTSYISRRRNYLKRSGFPIRVLANLVKNN